MASDVDGSAGSLRSRALALRALVLGPRSLLAAKAALAAAAAWLLADHVPGVADDYPYYAPLGALISMYPTLMGSARAGLQTLAGLAIGILLAGGVLLLGEPTVLSIAAVVAVGVLIAGVRRLGAGQEYVPMAAMFVLIVGGPNAENYSIGYLVQMSVGVAVGLLVNVLVFPPLNFTAAALELSRFRNTLARQLDEIGKSLTESWPPDHEDWADRQHALAEGAAEVRSALNHAEESGKGNPRARFHRRDLGNDYKDLRALESITFYVRDISEMLTAAVWGRPFQAELPAVLCAPLSRVMAALGGLLRGWDTGTGEHALLADAAAALDDLHTRIEENRPLGTAALTPASAVAMGARRILDAVRLRLAPAEA